MTAAQPRLRVALVGLGNWGSRLLDALLASAEFEVVALCDANPATLAASRGPEARFTALPALLGASALDAVFVAVTPQLQAELGAQVLRAGCHLFVEKPMALSSEDAAHLLELAALSERIVCVGHVVRYLPVVREAERVIASGAIGRVRRVFCERLGARPRAGVSPWWILAPHDLSFLLANFPGEACWLRVERDLVGGTWATLSLGGAVLADLRIAAEGTPRRATVVLGDGGSLVFDEGSSTLRRYSRAVDFGLEPDWVAIAQELGSLSAEIRTLPGQPLQLELRAFYEAIVRDRALPTDVRDGYSVVSALESADRWALAPPRLLGIERNK